MRRRAHLLAFTLRGPEKFSRSRIQHPSSTTCVPKGALGSGCSQGQERSPCSVLHLLGGSKVFSPSCSGSFSELRLRLGCESREA